MHGLTIHAHSGSTINITVNVYNHGPQSPPSQDTPYQSSSFTIPSINDVRTVSQEEHSKWSNDISTIITDIHSVSVNGDSTGENNSIIVVDEDDNSDQYSEQWDYDEGLMDEDYNCEEIKADLSSMNEHVTYNPTKMHATSTSFTIDHDLSTNVSEPGPEPESPNVKTFNLASILNMVKNDSKLTMDDPNLFSCSWCDKKFKLKGALVQHVRVHTNDRPYECQICFKAFKQQSHLDNHTLIHRDIKPHSCRICNQSFRQIANLRKHIAGHQDPSQKAPTRSLKRRRTRRLRLPVAKTEYEVSTDVK